MPAAYVAAGGAAQSAAIHSLAPRQAVCDLSNPGRSTARALLMGDNPPLPLGIRLQSREWAKP
jgi:hypothetical protein